MRKLYFILFSAFITCCLFSCGKDGGSNNFIPGNPQSLILGRWNLQKENYTQYVNGVKQTDTIVATSNYFVSYVQFNQNGSYVSASHAFSNSGTGLIASQDYLAGTYSISNNSFSLSAPYLGGGFGIGSATFTTSTEVPVITLVSHIVQLNQLTATLLTIHTEIVTTYTYSSTSITTNYKTVADMYYSK